MINMRFKTGQSSASIYEVYYSYTMFAGGRLSSRSSHFMKAGFRGIITSMEGKYLTHKMSYSEKDTDCCRFRVIP